MKRSLFILVLYTILSNCFNELLGQSIFEDYGTSITTLDAAPYTSISLDAMDYNPAGIVFLRKGLGLSLNSLWPRWHSIENENTFKVDEYEVNRICLDRSRWGVPNPSVRISYRYGDNAWSFSYAHGEGRFEGNGNTYFDDITQGVLTSDIRRQLLLFGIEFAVINIEVNQLATQINQQFGLDVKSPYPLGTAFPMTILSSRTQFGCRSDRFSTGYSHRFNVGTEDRWEYLSLYLGLKYQRMSLGHNVEVRNYCVNHETQTVFTMQELCDSFAGFYYDLADKIPEMSDYYGDLAKMYENKGRYCDTMYLRYSHNNDSVKGGEASVVLGFNWASPYWNLAAKAEIGHLPLKLSLGYSCYIGQVQLSTGIDFGYANESKGLYSELFKQELNGKTGDHAYCNVGIGLAYNMPRFNLIVKSGMVYGINNDVCYSNGYGVFLVKKDLLMPSCGFQWSLSSLLTINGGFRVLVPVGTNEFNMNGVYYSGAVCRIKPECQISIGFVAHLE